MLNDNVLDAGFAAAVQCVEEAVVNAMIAARDMGGKKWDFGTVREIDHLALKEVLRRFG